MIYFVTSNPYSSILVLFTIQLVASIPYSATKAFNCLSFSAKAKASPQLLRDNYQRLLRHTFEVLHI